MPYQSMLFFSFTHTLPLIEGQCGVVMAVIIRCRLRKIVGIPQIIEVRMLQSNLCSGPLVPVQNQHLLQHLDGCEQTARGSAFSWSINETFHYANNVKDTERHCSVRSFRDQK